MAKEKKKQKKSKDVINKIIKKKRKNRNEKSGYSQDDVKKALLAVEQGMSYGDAARKFHVPKTTIYSKSKNIYPLNARKGPTTVLTSEEEKRIVKWITNCGDRAFPVTKRLLIKNIKLLLDESKRTTIFQDNLPGPKWFKLFLKRHKELSIRMAQNLTKSRTKISEGAIRNWFEQVKKYLEKKGLQDIDSSRVFNLDESAFMLCPKADLVIVRRGSKAVHKTIDGDEKESLTVLYTVSADGKLAPPMILYWYKRIPNNVAKKIPSGWSFGSTETGWMNSESFYQYIEKVFYPWLVSKNVTFPVVVYLDGHASHMSLRLSTFCSEKQIELIALFPNSTHILQPCDVSLFRPLKRAWKTAADDWRIKNAPQPLRKEDFAPVLKEATDSINFTRVMQKGFETCGLYPLNPDAVAYNKLKDLDSQKNVSPMKNKTQHFQKTNPDTNEDKNLLQLFEKKLAPTLLEEFHSSNVREERNLGLYDYWRNLKNLADETVDETLHVNDLTVVLVDADGSEIVLDNDLVNVLECGSNINSFSEIDSNNNSENLVYDELIEPLEVVTSSIHQKASITTPVLETIVTEENIKTPKLGHKGNLNVNLLPVIDKCATISNKVIEESLSILPSVNEECHGTCSFSKTLKSTENIAIISQETPINNVILTPEKNEAPLAQKIFNQKSKPKIIQEVIWNPAKRSLILHDENCQPLNLSVATSPNYNISHTDIPIISPHDNTFHNDTDVQNNNNESKTTGENVIENYINITAEGVCQNDQRTDKKKESPFKRVFSSPKIPEKKTKTSTTKKVLTPVITSEVWRQQQLDLQLEKQKKEEEKEVRKQKKELKKKEDEELRKKKLEIQAKNKKEREEKKELAKQKKLLSDKIKKLSKKKPKQ